MATVGLVVNPGASWDVRRLTSLARTIDANEQANTIARVLGVGRARPRAAVVDGAIVPRTLVVLSLTFDHQVVDGALAAAFLDALARRLEDPSGLTD